MPRDRLFSLLDRGREASIVWVTGPPGCGKTTLVASYLDTLAIPSLWYQLDDGDADVATFFYYLRLAATEEDDVDRDSLPLLTPEYHTGLPTFTRRYFQALFARMAAPFVVVFDGYDEVPSSSKLHEVMREALHQLPPGGCAIIISRGDPPPLMARFRANRRLAVLGWEDLRLNTEETASIIRLRGRTCSEAALAELCDKTQGWAAGLVLMLEQAKMSDSVAEPPDMETRELVFDYLAGEIFQRTDSRTREFLLKTVFLAQMTTPIAQELTGDPEAGAILSELHRNGFFVVLRQARPEPVYQYHPMFREFLLSRATETLAKDQRRRLQQVSARLMEAAGQLEDAITLLRESGDWDEMARAIDAHAAAMLLQGRGETLVRWVEDLPAAVARQHPRAVYWAAASHLQIAPRESRLLFERAFELFRESPTPDVEGLVLACSGAMYAILYELDDFSLLDRWIAVLDEVTQNGTRFPSEGIEARVACSMFMSLLLRQPQRPDIEQWVERAFVCSQAADPNLRMEVGLLAAVAIMWTGHYTKAMNVIELMRKVGESPGVSPFALITLKFTEAMFYMLTARHELCLKATREGLELARATGVHTWTFQLMVYGVGGALGGQDLDSAAKLLKDLEARKAGTGRGNLCLYYYFSAWDAILRKDLMRALAEQRQALRMAVEVGSPYFEALCRLALAQILAECGDERKAVSHLHHVHGIVRRIQNRHLEFTSLLGYAQLALEHGRERSGVNALRYGLSLGRQYNYTHFLWWRPALMARLCAHALKGEIEVDYVRNLIATRNLALETPSLAIEQWPWTFRIYTLGPFRFLKHDAPLAFTGKAQRRPMELLKVLIAYGGEAVSEDHVSEALWPRVPGDSAHRSLTSTLHRLRKLLGEARAVTLREGRLTLDRRYVWTDAWALDQLAHEIDVAFRQPRPALNAAMLATFAERMLALYKGPFLATDPEAAWGIHARERLRNRFMRAMTEVGRYWEECGQWDRALVCYEKSIEADPLAEGFYRHLMICFQHRGRRAEAIEAYNRCRKALSALHIEPASETRALYEQLTRVESH